MGIEPRFEFAHKTRFCILVLCLVCLTFIMSNSLALNFTVICMDDVIEEQTPVGYNATVSPHWLQSSESINSLFSAVAIGTLIGTLLLMECIKRLGLRCTMVLYGFVSGGATLLLPLGVQLGGFWAVFVARVLQGFSVALSFPVTGAVAAAWSSLKQSSTYIAILSTHVQLCSIFTMPVAGVLCSSSFGWRSLYFLQGGLTVFFFALLGYFYTESPHMHRNVSSKELDRIQKGKGNESTERRVPYKEICTDKVIIATWVSLFGGNLAFNLFMNYGPTYMNKVLHFDVRSTGFVVALPYILSGVVKLGCGPLSDYTTCISERAKIVLFASLSQGVMGCCIAGLALTGDATVAQILYTAAIVASGLNVIGTVKCAQLVARRFVSFILTVTSFNICLINLALPVVVAWVASENSPQQWSAIFLGVAGIVVVTNIPFFFLASAQPADWALALPTPKPSAIYVVQDKPIQIQTNN